MNEYDITIHLGQQIENFLNSYSGADVEAMVLVTSNFKDICKNSELLQIAKQFDEWKQYRQNESDKIAKENAQKTAEKLLKIKNIDEYMITLEEAKQTPIEPLNKLEKEYWASIRGLMLRSVKTE